MDVIPRKIHLIAAGKEASPQYIGYVTQMRALHPLWDIIIWDDATAMTVIEQYFPHWKQDYCAYKVPVQKTDIFRCMVVYLHGGFYLDMDIHCLRSLDDLCNYDMVLGVEKTLSPGECSRLQDVYPVRIANYMFASRPYHSFWLDFLNAAKRMAGASVDHEADVLNTTGPGLLTRVYHENIHRYNDITLLPNEDRACLKSCGPASCHFGDYAVHMHLGSWRWETGNK